jgi:hypothetical protein
MLIPSPEVRPEVTKWSEIQISKPEVRPEVSNKWSEMLISSPEVRPEVIIVVGNLNFDLNPTLFLKRFLTFIR